MNSVSFLEMMKGFFPEHKVIDITKLLHDSMVLLIKATYEKPNVILIATKTPKNIAIFMSLGCLGCNYIAFHLDDALWTPTLIGISRRFFSIFDRKVKEANTCYICLEEEVIDRPTLAQNYKCLKCYNSICRTCCIKLIDIDINVKCPACRTLILNGEFIIHKDEIKHIQEDVRPYLRIN
jgi:hypothetical protein